MNSNKVWHAGNDGSGSGLDADLWDGNNFAAYLDQAVRTNSDVTFTSVTTNQVNEKFTTIANAAGVITHDCSLGRIFSHSSITANFTCNFANLNVTSGYAAAITIILNQGVTAFTPNAVQISGATQTINWSNGITPDGNPNKKDIVTFSILNSSGTYTVFGQLATFG